MLVRTRQLAIKLRASLWPVPVLAVVVGAAAGLVIPRLDEARGLHDLLGRVDLLVPLLDTDSRSAQTILGSVAGALATLLGVLFSITIVALQLASSQYSPRVIPRFRADRLSRTVLASLICTVTFLVVALPGLPSEAPPRVTLVVAILLALSCFCLVPIFLHHLARLIDSATIIRQIGADAVEVARRLEFDHAETLHDADFPPDPRIVRAISAGYVVEVDRKALRRAVPRGARMLRLEARMGDFVIPGLPLLAIWPRVELDEATRRRICAAFVLKEERRQDQDLLFCVRQLVDVALRALSAAINDVTTAVMAVNELGLVVEAFQSRNPAVEDGFRKERCGDCVLFVPTLGLRTFLRDCFDEIARDAGSQLRVTARMLEVMEQVIEAARPPPEHREVYAQTGRWIEESAAQEGATTVEKAYFDERYRSLLRRAAGVALPDEEPALQ